MDLEKTLKELLDGFETERIRYALMGGFALAALGASRTTADLDFLVHRDDLERLDRLLTALGYRRRFHTENVSQYMHDNAAWAAVDVVHAFRKASLGMLQRAFDKPVFGGSRLVRVLQPEDVIGLKVQTMANDPDRRAQEMADIETLLGLYRARLDWSPLGEYFGLFGFGQEFESLRRRFAYAQ